MCSLVESADGDSVILTTGEESWQVKSKAEVVEGVRVGGMSKVPLTGNTQRLEVRGHTAEVQSLEDSVG